ncbi:hypothetical protein [Desertivirga brevis]|uniref:hypothetical protein n=1 Tax=Desertivirga brevis TaxID=2810310 RepID=UPI001A96F0B3|nr:hypothetical protein [Pedobacter sp. SYSU D00873]
MPKIGIIVKITERFDLIFWAINESDFIFNKTNWMQYPCYFTLMIDLMHLPEENQQVNSGNTEKHPGNDIETVTSENENMHPVPEPGDDGEKEKKQG